jgi:ribosomal protein L15
MTIDETTLTPEIIAHFTEKYKGVADKNTELLGKVTAYKGIERELETLGGLDQVKALKAAADTAQAQAEEARLNALKKDNKVGELEQHYNGLLAERDGKLSKLQQSLVNREVEAALATAIAEAEGSAKLLMPHLRGRVEASIDADGNVTMTVKGAAGQTTGEDGKPLTLKALIAEAKKDPDFGAAFKAHQASGAGNRAGNGKAGENPFATATLSVTKQMQLIKANPDLARTLAKDAGVSPSW